jgi:restriction system protein
MAIPKYDELYRDILQSLADGAQHKSTATVEVVSHTHGLTAEECAKMLPSGTKSVIYDRVNWARTYLKKAGLISAPKRGFSQITEAGIDVLNQPDLVIDNQYLSRFESFKGFYQKNAVGSDEPITPVQNQDATPLEQIDGAFGEINTALADELLDEIMSLSPTFLEQLIVKLLVRMGYGGAIEGAGIVTPHSSDGGIDGIIREDKLGFSNIYIQAKRYDRDGTVSRPEIQKFIGAIAEYKNKKGLFVTTAKFSAEAKKSAEASQIVLIDGERLAKLMIEYGVGVSTVQSYEIKRLDTDFFNE